jgi:predicted transcriptional regulator
MFREYQEREAAAQRAKEEAEKDTSIPTLNFKSVVKIIK